MENLEGLLILKRGNDLVDVTNPVNYKTFDVRK